MEVFKMEVEWRQVKGCSLIGEMENQVYEGSNDNGRYFGFLGFGGIILTEVVGDFDVILDEDDEEVDESFYDSLSCSSLNFVVEVMINNKHCYLCVTDIDNVELYDEKGNHIENETGIMVLGSYEDPNDVAEYVGNSLAEMFF